MYYTHINRNIIDSNRKHKKTDPPVRFQKGKYGKAEYALEVEITGTTKVMYAPENEAPILPCGARLVIVSEEKPTIIR